jgi:hypothetical protein
MRCGGWPSSRLIALKPFCFSSHHIEVMKGCAVHSRLWMLWLSTSFNIFHPFNTSQHILANSIWCHKEVSGSCRRLWCFGLSGSDSTRGSACQYFLKYFDVVWEHLVGPTVTLGVHWFPAVSQDDEDLPINVWASRLGDAWRCLAMLGGFPAFWFGSCEPRLRVTEGVFLDVFDRQKDLQGIDVMLESWVALSPPA